MKKVLRVMLLICFALLSLQVMAQDKTAKAQPMAETPASEWLQVSVVRVKPEMVTEYVAFQKSETLPGLKKAGLKWRDAWETGVFGEGFEYVFVTPIEKFAQYDGPGPMMRALGDEGARAYNEKLRRFLISSHTFAVRMRPDLSYAGKMTWPPKLAVIAWVDVAQGRTAEYENFIKTDWAPAMKKADVAGYFVSQIVFGGSANGYITLTALDNFADIDKGPPVVRALGQAGADKLGQKVSGIVTHVERSVSRYNADLSIAPAQMPSK